MGLLAATTATGAAQQRPSGTPDWVHRFFAAEARGPKFGHAWIARAGTVRALNAALDRQAALPPGQYALRGVFRLAVLAGTFADVTPRFTSAEYDSAFFGMSAAGRFYTLSRYFSEVSGGAFTFDGAVTPWIRLDSTRAYYIDSFSGFGRGRFEEYIYDVLVRADSFVDWRQFDNDGSDGVPNSGDDDGYVDVVAFLHPLADGIYRRDSLGGFVATGWRLQYLAKMFGGRPFVTRVIGASGTPLLVDDFILSAGLDPFGNMALVNINAHEMGHALGLPDLYDLDGSSFGVGNWDLMSYGGLSSGGFPAHPGAWARRQLGWADIIEITGNRSLRLDPVEAVRTVARIPVPDTREYFLLENRQRLGADVNLPGSGLLLWHVDDDVLDRLLPYYRANEDETRPGVAVLQADGLDELARRLSSGDPGDPFPGSSGNHRVDDTTSPGMRSNLGMPSRITLRNITEAGGVVTLDIAIGRPGLALDVRPPAAFVPVSGSLRLTATVRDSTDTPVSGFELRWLSSNPSVAQVSQLGLVTGIKAGDVTISVSSPDAGVSATVPLSVAPISAVFRSVTGGAPLSPQAAQALDRQGNRNGRVDVGDLWLLLSRSSAPGGAAP